MFHNFSVDFKDKRLQGYINVLSKDSAWIWVGEKSVQSIGHAHHPLFSMLVEGAGGQREFIKAMTLRLSKNLGVQQVVFSTDLQEEQPEYWNELYAAIFPQLKEFITVYSKESTN